MNEIQKRLGELVEKYDTLKNVATTLDIDYSYLTRLASGEKCCPGPRILRKMKLRKVTVISYEKI